jgi:hypothetical protein
VRSPIGTAVIAILALFASCAGAAAEPQGQASGAAQAGAACEFAFYGGVSPAPGEIGRDVNRAGGDILIASLGTSGVFGTRFEVNNSLLGGGVTVLAWLGSVGVENEAGIEFPHHGKPPLIYLGEARLYPFREWLARGRVSPYLSAGLGGALVSVDLDNVNDQELRHLWTWSGGAGVRILVDDDGATFVDVQFRACFLSGNGPLVPFTLRSIVVGAGMRR